MIKKRLLSLLLVCAFLLPTIPVSAKNSSGVIKEDTIIGRLAQIDDSGIEDFCETDEVAAENVILSFEKNTANVSLSIDSQQYNFALELMPSCLAPYSETTVIGVDSTSKELISFRIEKDAKKIGLMPNCGELEGKTILYLGILNDVAKELYYFQVDLGNFEIDKVIKAATLGFAKSNYSCEDAERIEVTYLTLARAKPVHPQSSTDFSTTFDLEEMDGNISSEQTVDSLSLALDQLKEVSAGKFIKLNEKSTRSLINGIPDSVFKSGEYDKWIKGWNGWAAKTGYAVMAFPYGLSNDGRLHYVVTFSISNKVNWDTQTFDISFKITNNCWVLYLYSANELSIFDSSARAAIDPEIYYRSKTDTGVFTRRYYTIKKADTLTDRATKFVIGYIPYVGDAVELYETLSGSGDLSAGKVYPFADSYELQKAEGKIIKKVSVFAEKLKQIDDYIYLRLEGDGIKNVTYGFSYKPYDPVWW